MKERSTATAALVALCVAACGSEGQATVNGSVSGTSLDPQSAVFTHELGPNSLYLYIANHSSLCAVVQQTNAEKANTTQLLLVLVDNTGSMLTTTTYAVPQSGSTLAYGRYETTNAMCNNTLPSNGYATAGTVTLNEISDGSISGTFSLSFGGGSLEGTFGAAACDVANSVDAATPGATCVQ